MINYLLNKIRKKTKELSYCYQKNGGTYNQYRNIRKSSKENILNNIRKDKYTENYISIESYYNGNYYPLYDIDDKENLKFLNLNESYVVIMSSNNHSEALLDIAKTGYTGETRVPHYWVIVDKPTKNWKEHTMIDDWLVLCDSDFINFIKNKGFHIRSFFKNMESKPSLIKEFSKMDGCSEDFKEFITKLMKQYDDFGLHISSLISKDPKLLAQYKRQKKLERVLNEQHIIS